MPLILESVLLTCGQLVACTVPCLRVGSCWRVQCRAYVWAGVGVYSAVLTCGQLLVCTVPCLRVGSCWRVQCRAYV